MTSEHIWAFIRFLLSRLVGRNGIVCAFEPNAGILHLLEKTLKDRRNVKLFKHALADETSDAVLYVPDSPDCASLADWTVGRLPDRAKETRCETRRIDDLFGDGLLPRPDFIKCDVEGAEPLVFRGARSLLDRADAPIVLFESNFYTSRGFNFTPSTSMDFFHGLKAPCYSFFKIGDGGVLSELGEADHIHANILGVPHSKLKRVSSLITSRSAIVASV